MGHLLQPHDVLGDLAALHAGHAAERQLAADVARRVNVVDIALTVMVDGDVAASPGLDAGGLEAEALGVGHRADGQHGVAGARHPAVVATHHHFVAVTVDGRGAGTLQQAHSPTQEVVFQNSGDLGVFHRQHLLTAHDQGHLGAEAGEHVHELDTCDARADHGDARREDARRVAVAGDEDALAIGLAPLGYAGAGAGGHEHGVGRDQPGAGLGGHLHFLWPHHPGRAADQLDPLALQQSGRVALEMVLDVFDALGQPGDVDLGHLLLEPHPADPPGEAHRPTGGDHRLRRDAVPQMGRAANDVAFDQGDLGAEPGRMGGRSVPRGPTTDDDEACRHGEEATASGQPSVQPSPANIVPL